MTDILLVDGYNIINAWPGLKQIARENLNDARKQLVDILLDYQGYKGIKIILVFDAHMIRGGQEKKELYGDLEVVFTKENETADHYIERWTDRITRDMRVMVATSDHLQQTIVLSKGAVRISARELLEHIQEVQKDMAREYLDKPKPKTNTLGDRANPEIIEILERWRRQR